jgi:GPR1/FUN34/yaaH family
VFAVFFTFEVTEILVFVGYFMVGAGHITSGTDILHVAGYVGVLTAACAWYACAAGVLAVSTTAQSRSPRNGRPRAGLSQGLGPVGELRLGSVWPSKQGPCMAGEGPAT